MPDRYLIMSDLHLGRQPWRATADMLRRVWEGFDHLIINGDVAELYDPRYIAEAEKQTLRLQELCETDKITLTLIAGNHDPYVTEQRYLYLADGKILLTHGDTIDPAIAPWCDTAPLMRQTFHSTIASFPIENREMLETRLTATHHAALAKWEFIKNDLHSVGFKRMLRRPWSFYHVIRYWQRFPHEATKFMAYYAPSASMLITGHTHRQGYWTVGARTVINTGAFAFPGQPHVVAVEGSKVDYYRLVRQNEQYVLPSRPLRSFSV